MRLSACILAKNEQDNIPRCLTSIRSYADEIIVVDTGSTDDTVEIARSFGAKVYHHPWQKDFALHRNQAFEYATGDWHLVIDCDEELVMNDVDPDEFKGRLEKVHGFIGALVAWVNEVDAGEQVTLWPGNRFFRATSKPYYEKYVHNKARYDGLCGNTDIVINHYGYSLDPEKMAAKRERTLELLNKRINDDSEDYEAYYYLAQIALGEGVKSAEKAIEYGTKCFELIPIDDGKELGHFANVYFWMANAHLWLKDGNKAYDWAAKGLSLFPDDVDLNYVMAQIGYSAEMDDVLKEYGERYLEAVGKRKEELYNNKPKPFASFMDPDKFINRTVYTWGSETEKQVRGWLEAV